MVVAEVWLTQLILKFDLYIVSITDPLEGLSYTVFLGILVWLGRFDDIVKFAIARTLSLALKFGIIRTYLAKKKQSIEVLRPIPMEDPFSHDNYYVHASTKEFCIQFSYSSIIGFAFSNLERFVQVTMLSLKDLGIYTLILNIGENLINMFLSSFIDFFTNLFNLKFSEYIVTVNPKRVAELTEDLKGSLFKSIKYSLLFHQLMAIYGHYLCIDESILRVFGSKFGQRVESKGYNQRTGHFHAGLVRTDRVLAQRVLLFQLNCVAQVRHD